MVSAQVVDENGQDTYRNVMLNGKHTNKDIMAIGGQRTTGEFGGLLLSLFEPVRNTQFTYERTATIGDHVVAIYSFVVALGNSDWQVLLGGQQLFPTYSGRIWVDKKTAQIRRLEQHADKIPKDFPESSVEVAIDYDSVLLGSSEFFLPIQSESISCMRGTEQCARNVLAFRNYHRYAGESTITFP